MPEAAHPQRDDAEPASASGEPPPAGETPTTPSDGPLAKNPFPPAMTVPGVDGTPVTVQLAVLDGVVYAPGLDDLPLAPQIRQYVTQYCAAWSSSVLTTGKLTEAPPAPPRRGQLVFDQGQLHAMLGLAGDESLVAVVVDPLTTAVRFVIDSPRLPRKPAWNCEPPRIGLPVAAWYEGSEALR